MINIVLTDQTIQISGKEEELKKIKNYETYNDQKTGFSKGGFDPRRIKHVSLMKEIKGRLVGFAGLTKEIVLFCKNNNIKIDKFEDKRTHFDFQEKEYSKEELREFFPKNFKYVEHQISALEAMLKTNKGIVTAPTSAGKSKIISAFIRLSNLPTLILTDRSTLGAQLAEDLRKDGIDCGFCSGSGVKQGYCMVSTIQSVKKLGDLHRFQCVINDEVHRASSKSFQDFLASFGCPLKYGFSASPSNGNLLDFAKIRQHYGSIIIQVKAEELIENEVMAKPVIRLVETECPVTLDYPSANELGIVHNDLRNRQIKEIVDHHIGKGGVCILVKNLDHGKILKEMIPYAAYLKGEDSLTDRMNTIKRFNDGEIPVLIGSGILNEGISISNMKVLIMAGGCKAQTQTIQKIGRVLRITENKKQGIFYDFIDLGNKYLLKHSKQRISLYKKEGYKDITLLKSVNELDIKDE